MDPTTSTIFNLPINQAFRDTSESVTRASDYPNRYRHEDVYVERDGKHKGVGGAARGILGFLGDLLLTRLHMPAQFGPGEQRRKMTAAQQGFDQDPESAINRVASIDPNAGMKMREQYTDNQRVAAQNAATNEARQARIDLVQADRDQKTRFYGASALNSMADWTEEKRKANWPTMRNQILVAGKKQGLDLSDELPEQYDPVQIDAFIDAAVPVGTQRSQRLTDRRLDITETQGNRRLNQGDRKLSQGDRRLDQGDRIIGQGDTRLEQGDRRLEQGDIKIEQDDRRIDQGDTRLEQGETKIGQTDRRLEQTAPVIRIQTIGGVKYKFKLVGKDWVNIGPAK